MSVISFGYTVTHFGADTVPAPAPPPPAPLPLAGGNHIAIDRLLFNPACKLKQIVIADIVNS